jgi:integrase
LLTNKTIDGAKPKSTQYKIADSHGLYIVITPRNIKSWRCNYRDKVTGKHKTHTFGRYPDISLAKARLLNSQFKDAQALGMFNTVPTFDKVKKDWYLHKLPKLKNIKHKQQVIYRLDTFVSPKIGHMQIDAIRRVNLVEVVQSIQQGGIIETAHRVGTHIRQVFDYAVDMGHIESHSAIGLSRVLQTPKTKNMPCVPLSDAPALLKSIYNYDEIMARTGLMLLCLTFVRTSELRYMRWSEIKDKCFWVIPAERMKMKRPHVVPLSKLTLEVLRGIEPITGDCEFVLHSPIKRDKPVSENFFLDALYRMGYRGKMTGHGFRALASTVLNQESPFKSDVIERQLAHKESDAVRAAYNRAEYLEERIKLMDWYSDWVLKGCQATL